MGRSVSSSLAMNPKKADTRGGAAAVARHSQEMLEVIPIEHVSSASVRPRYAVLRLAQSKGAA